MSIEYSPLLCCSCGVAFALNSDHMRGLRESHKTFYCPNGCPQCYRGPSKAEQLEQVKAQLNAAQARLADLKNGKCPFCLKYFKDLSSHFSNRHK